MWRGLCLNAGLVLAMAGLADEVTVLPFQGCGGRECLSYLAGVGWGAGVAVGVLCNVLCQGVEQVEGFHQQLQQVCGAVAIVVVFACSPEEML